MTHTFRSQRGFTYIAAMVTVIILGIVLGSASTYWSTRMKRERETELLFRGIQYRDAIRAWYGYDPVTATTNPAILARRGLQQPLPLRELKDLLKDPNSTSGARYLRKLYPDPVKSFETGKPEDFDVVRGANQEIIGVKSKSEAKPLKQANFDDDPRTGLEPSDFEGKEKYSDWQFIYNRAPKPGTAGGVKGLKTAPGPGTEGAP